MLDESLVQSNTIMMNRFAKPLMPKVEELSKTMAKFSQTLEEWLICMKTWSELEKIFSSLDISKNLGDKA